MTYVPIHVKAMGCQLFYVYGVAMTIPPTADVGGEKGLGILGFNIPNPKFPDGDMPLAEPSVHLYRGVGKNSCQPNKLRQQLLKVYRLLKQGPQMTSTQ